MINWMPGARPALLFTFSAGARGNSHRQSCHEWLWAYSLPICSGGKGIIPLTHSPKGAAARSRPARSRASMLWAPPNAHDTRPSDQGPQQEMRVTKHPCWPHCQLPQRASPLWQEQGRGLNSLSAASSCCGEVNNGSGGVTWIASLGDERLPPTASPLATRTLCPQRTQEECCGIPSRKLQAGPYLLTPGEPLSGGGAAAGGTSGKEHRPLPPLSRRSPGQVPALTLSPRYGESRIASPLPPAPVRPS